MECVFRPTVEPDPDAEFAEIDAPKLFFRSFGLLARVDDIRHEQQTDLVAQVLKKRQVPVRGPQTRKRYEPGLERSEFRGVKNFAKVVLLPLGMDQLHDLLCAGLGNVFQRPPPDVRVAVADHSEVESIRAVARGAGSVCAGEAEGLQAIFERRLEFAFGQGPARIERRPTARVDCRTGADDRGVERVGFRRHGDGREFRDVQLEGDIHLGHLVLAKRGADAHLRAVEEMRVAQLQPHRPPVQVCEDTLLRDQRKRFRVVGVETDVVVRGSRDEGLDPIGRAVAFEVVEHPRLGIDAGRLDTVQPQFEAGTPKPGDVGRNQVPGLPGNRGPVPGNPVERTRRTRGRRKHADPRGTSAREEVETALGLLQLRGGYGPGGLGRGRRGHGLLARTGRVRGSFRAGLG